MAAGSRRALLAGCRLPYNAAPGSAPRAAPFAGAGREAHYNVYVTGSVHAYSVPPLLSSFASVVARPRWLACISAVLPSLSTKSVLAFSFVCSWPELLKDEETVTDRRFK